MEIGYPPYFPIIWRPLDNIFLLIIIKIPYNNTIIVLMW